MTERGWLCGLLLLASGIAAAATRPGDLHVCVPGADGRWKCGNAEQPPQAEALPERKISQGSQPVPPVLLMDPARFRVNEPVSAAPAPTAAPTAQTVATSSAQPAANPAPAVAASAPRPSPAAVARPRMVAATAPVQSVQSAGAASGALRDFATVTRSGYTVQLAAAQSPAGFVQHLRRLGIPGDQAFAVPVQRSGAALWLLCVGEYADAASARAALPAGTDGAFPKALSQLHAEYSGSR